MEDREFDPASDAQDTIDYVYEFVFSDGSKKEFSVRLDYNTLNMVTEPRPAYPPWTALEFCQCPNCPLRPREHPYCPVATTLVPLIDFFKDIPAQDDVLVQVRSKRRTISNRTALQKGLSALMGLLMASSGCPILGRMKPMVETHLPFATADETIYRFLAMYLVAQYFAYRRGESPDWDLEELIAYFEEVRTVNLSFCRRLKAIDNEGATIRAVALLEDMADFTGFLIQSDELGRLENIFDTSSRS
ncbi:MAG TPA: hypothetical protein PKW35_18730 [Nannocystaceae bacterium]|nr:hypothetical protein [Nannocystaceae bacterium]